MADRYGEDRFFGPEDQYQVRGAPRARDRDRSGAREYVAAGIYDDRGGTRERWDYPQQRGRGYYQAGERNFGQRREFNRDQDRSYARDDHDSRGFFERAGDEVRSWFGDEEAERRRERDMREDAGYARGRSRRDDPHYSAWRQERMAELDRDYDEYRRENAQRFHNEFSTWRTERQGQRDGLSRVEEHMEVLGSDGSPIGTVDRVRGDRIILTKSDPEAGGHHHSIPSRWIQSVTDKITLRKTAEEAKAAWRDEERGAMFGEDRDDRNDWRSDHNLNRACRGTY